MAATRGYAEGWIQYDEQYRLRKAHYRPDLTRLQGPCLILEERLIL
jgi:hypothetical protein